MTRIGRNGARIAWHTSRDDDRPGEGAPAARLVALALTVATLLTLVILGVSRGATHAVDNGLHEWVIAHRTPALTWSAVAATTLGSSIVVYPLILVLSSAGLWRCRRDRRRRRQTVVLLPVLATGSLVRFELSRLLSRARPPARDWACPASGYALPSGHTTTSAIAAGLVAWWVSRGVRTQTKRVLTWCVAVGFAGAVGISRFYLGVHWSTDVIAGWLLALCWLSLAAGPAALLASRRQPASTQLFPPESRPIDAGEQR